MLFKKYQNKVFVRTYLLALNINFNSERVFQDTKICKKSKFQGIWDELETKMCFFQTVLDEILQTNSRN